MWEYNTYLSAHQLDNSLQWNIFKVSSSTCLDMKWCIVLMKLGSYSNYSPSVCILTSIYYVNVNMYAKSSLNIYELVPRYHVNCNVTRFFILSVFAFSFCICSSVSHSWGKVATSLSIWKIVQKLFSIHPLIKSKQWSIPALTTLISSIIAQFVTKKHQWITWYGIICNILRSICEILLCWNFNFCHFTLWHNYEPCDYSYIFEILIKFAMRYIRLLD